MNNTILTLEAAQAVIARALEEAKRQGVAAAACVVDSGGHLVAFARMDGASYMAVDVTRRKAVTAGSFGVPTHVLTGIAASEPAVGADLAKNADVCMVAGGVPLRVNGVCVGGLGVGGGRSAQDQAIAEAGLSALPS